VSHTRLTHAGAVACVVLSSLSGGASGVLHGSSTSGTTTFVVELVGVGELEMEKATWGMMYDAMDGKPGDARSLILEHHGNRLTVAARVTAF
jgi:hypothetical protein